MPRRDHATMRYGGKIDEIPKKSMRAMLAVTPRRTPRSLGQFRCGLEPKCSKMAIFRKWNQGKHTNAYINTYKNAFQSCLHLYLSGDHTVIRPRPPISRRRHPGKVALKSRGGAFNSVSPSTPQRRRWKDFPTHQPPCLILLAPGSECPPRQLLLFFTIPFSQSVC